MYMEEVYIEALQVIRTGFLALILLIQSVWDIKSKRLPIWITGVGALVGILLWFLRGSYELSQFVAMIPGILCIVFAKVSKEAIGYGDGLLLSMMGIYLEFSVMLGVCLWAFILAGFLALFLLVMKKKKGKQEIPFVPFLFIGFLLEVFLC